MSNQGHRTLRETAAVALLIIVLSLPAWYATGLMARQSGAGGSVLGALAFIVIAFGLIGPGLALFFSWNGSGRGNMRAARIAAIASVLFAILFFVAAHPYVAGGSDAPENVGSTQPAGFTWGIAIVGGPLVFLCVMAWVAVRNRASSAEEKRHTEEATKALYERSDIESKKRDHQL